MTRASRIRVTTTLFILLTGIASLGAHQSFRILGTIAKVTATTLDVKQTKDGKVIVMDLDEATMVMRGEKKLSIKDLKAGLSVVVDARGDSIDELLVRKVAIGAATTKK